MKTRCFRAHKTYQLKNFENRGKMIHDTESLECEICHKTYGPKDSLKIALPDRSKSFECEISHQSFGYQNRLKNHIIKTHSPARIHKEQLVRACKCSSSPRATIERGERRRKKNQRKRGSEIPSCRQVDTVHEGRKDYSCDVCERKFGQRWIMIQHRRTVHEGRKDYTCDKSRVLSRFECVIVVKNTIIFRTNIEKTAAKTLARSFLHKNNTRRSERLCLRQMREKIWEKSHLLDHLKSVHEKRVFENYLCDDCGKNFGSKRYLRLHITIVHDGRKDHVCDRCEEKFGIRSNLLKHQKTVHEGRRDYACDHCEKKFGDPSNLKRHQRIVHNGRKDFALAKRLQ
ncbi:unnamed protein product [Trichogramma brassicae]|uniref:C2H2-type domain-containing protein n=1 Tax=Trichogramma brassicae TaxID=86971 RepID=A0A6H5ILG6_9HYME|nr:unnamed protein product [Trichogramma brassicae]